MLFSPQNLLKLDIVGALVTCTVTAAVFATELIPTGMPSWILWMMSLAAGIFCLIGIAGYFRPHRWLPTLQRLAILNFCFCVGSGIAWLVNFQQLTVFGRIYFPIEIFIVIAIAIVEYSNSRAANTSSRL
jgi:drug/metabolite transporter superfamily protein YnfA